MAERYRVTVREGPRVTHERHASLDDALDALDARVNDLLDRPTLNAVNTPTRTYEPDALVAARAELRGPQRFSPSIRAGVDIRGDGAAEAWLGGASRQTVAREDDESAVAALRRVLMNG